MIHYKCLKHIAVSAYDKNGKPMKRNFNKTLKVKASKKKSSQKNVNRKVNKHNDF